MNKNTEFSRRGFLKTLGLAGATMEIEPTLNKVQAATSIMKLPECVKNTITAFISSFV